MVDVDVIVVGGGVIGLACGLEAARRGKSVVVLERRARFGEETSTHNSGVAHAGIYYPEGSLKARLCVAGHRLLRETLSRWKVPARFSGKLIVAGDENEVPTLEGLLATGRANGVSGLEIVDREFIRSREPNVRGIAALWSPHTGVFDVGEFVRQLAARTASGGADLVPQAEVTAVDVGALGITVHTTRHGSIRGRRLVNAAGLYADHVARLCGETGHTIYPCRGEYAVVVPRRAGLIRHLVYPVPRRLSLGVHLTRTVDGELWVGPNARYIREKDDYESDRQPPAEFLESARRLCPALTLDDLRMGQAGIRPKRYGPGEASVDYWIAPQAGEPRIIHLIGLESPGLTAALAVAQHVTDLTEA